MIDTLSFWCATYGGSVDHPTPLIDSILHWPPATTLFCSLTITGGLDSENCAGPVLRDALGVLPVGEDTSEPLLHALKQTTAKPTLKIRMAFESFIRFLLLLSVYKIFNLRFFIMEKTLFQSFRVQIVQQLKALHL